jgi:predicted ABC-type ATPase
LENSQSLIFETVFSTQEKLDYIRSAIQKKYFIRIFFISTNDPQININRVNQRFLEGGHDVKNIKIISRYYNSIANATILSKIVDRFYLYDNTEDFVEPKLLFRAENGILKKQYNPNLEWSQLIYDYLIKK